MSDDFKRDTEIDFYNLHNNWREHSSNFLEWGERWANAIRSRDKHKRKLTLAIRKNPEDYDLSLSPSQSSILATIESDEEYIEHCYEVNLLQSVKESFIHRRSALEALTKLYLNGYYSGPTDDVNKIKDELRKDRADRVRRSQLEALNKERQTHGGKEDNGEDA